MKQLCKIIALLCLSILALAGSAMANTLWVPEVSIGKDGSQSLVWEQMGGGERLPFSALCDGRITAEDVAWNVVVGDFDGDGVESPSAVLLETCEIVPVEDVYPGGVRLPDVCVGQDVQLERAQGPRCERSETHVMTQVRDFTLASSELHHGEDSRFIIVPCSITKLNCWEVVILDCNAGGACSFKTVTACKYRRCCLGVVPGGYSCTEYTVWE